MIRARTALGTLLAVAAAAMGLATLIGPPEEVVAARTGSEQAVLTSRLVCPLAGGVAGSTDTLAVTALPASVAPAVDAAPDAAAPAAPEPVTVVPLAPGAPGAAVLTLDARGPVVAAVPEVDAVTTWVATTQGALAPGLVAEQSSYAQSGDRRGLADTACGAGTDDAWFVGASGAPGHRARLVLGNTGSTPALVDVQLWDERGPVPTPAAEDLGIEANGQESLLLDALAPGSARLAVHVQVRKGRVAPAIQVVETEGVDPRGTSFVPSIDGGPQERVVVPGVPGSGDRTLMLAAPGDGDAIVALRVLGPDGPFSPAANSVVTVPAGTVLDVPVGDAVGGAPAAIELQSDRPVLAALRAGATQEGQPPDLAYTAPTAPLDRLGATLGARTTGGPTTDLLLSSVGDEDTSATLDVLDPSGAVVGTQQVPVAAGSTQAVRVAAPTSGDRQTLVVRPQDPGTLSVVRLVTGSDGATVVLDLLPLDEVPTTVRVPDVAGDLLTGLG